LARLGGKADSFPDELSEANSKESALPERLLTREPLIADEPTGNLDILTHPGEIMELLNQINKS
jgi:ABC-type ATPase involved in cell division